MSALLKYLHPLLILAATGIARAGDWYPVEIDVWEPPFNTRHQLLQESYIPLNRADKRWNICVAIPHLKDAYWLAVNYGLVDEARRMGVNLAIYEAGGYEHLDIQRKQISECLEKDSNGFQADGLILGAISADGLADVIKTAHDSSVPVLDLINGINSPHITARTAADFYGMGYQIGEYLRNLHPVGEEQINVAWFPGPEGAGWVSAGDKGFNDALSDSNIEVVVTKKGDTGKTVQARLIESVLDESADYPDYIAGTAVSAEAAVGILRSRGLGGDIGVLSYYYGPGVHQGIKRGTIIAAPTDSPVIQARMAVDTMVRILESKPYFRHDAPRIEVVDRTNQGAWNASTTLAPRGFRAIFSVGE